MHACIAKSKFRNVYSSEPKASIKIEIPGVSLHVVSRLHTLFQELKIATTKVLGFQLCFSKTAI